MTQFIIFIAAIIFFFFLTAFTLYQIEWYRSKDDPRYLGYVILPAFFSLCALVCAIIIGFDIAKNINGKNNKENVAANSTESTDGPASLPEVFTLPDGRRVTAGTLDELMQWIDDNAITHVEALSQLDSRDSLTRWRTLCPEGVPSREVREEHDTEEFLHYAVIKH